ncbi:magnesium transporter [Amphritea sp. 1_MG-2023]|uniref:magnesium transporter n=1 Tax=Amphritea sp. 1_MG-2023 TaxID=3062670 RepID=UPI0026E25900|nr:magnesium transporter [Amphritea sp. 1_MG-2023]MDO6563579.1 magnesium transporter [Amphritea sp. 1_MG-2023]
MSQVNLRIDQIHKAIEQQDEVTLNNLLEEVSASETARLIEASAPEKRSVIWAGLGVQKRAGVLKSINGEVRQYLIDNTSHDELLESLFLLQPDELADIDEDLPGTVINAMIAAMDELRKRRYNSVKHYPDDTAGGLMDTDTTAVRADVSILSVLRYLRLLRNKEGDMPEQLDSLMVVDRTNKLLGVLPLSDIVSLPTDTLVADILEHSFQAIPVDASQDKVARIFQDCDLLSAPVVDGNYRLLGRITIDDVVDVIQEQADAKVLRSAGLTSNNDMFSPVLSSAYKRGYWLGINLITAFVAAWVIGLFEAVIEQLIALAVLMPVVASMGGVAGSQTLTIVTRGLALNQIGRTNIAQLIFHEASVVFLNGLVWALTVAAIALYWFGDPMLGAVFGMALLIVLITGVIGGIFIPLILQRMSIDPAVAGSVVLTTFTDAIGFFSFLGLAKLLI